MNLDSLYAQRQRRVQRRRQWSSALGIVGRGLPGGARRWLGSRHPRLSHLRAADGVFDCRYLGEFDVRVDVSRGGIEREMVCGRYERALRESLRPHLHSGETVVDVGANVGALTFFFAQAVGPRGHVIAFEPGPVFHERLCSNLALNPALEDRVLCHRVGLGARSQTLFWKEDPLFPGNASLLAEAGVPVPVRTLDSFSLPRVDWIKIDVEGMELEVLQGAVQTLARLRPRILFESTLEFETIRGAPVRRQTQEFLHALGYRLCSVDGRGSFAPVAYPALPAMTLALP